MYARVVWFRVAPGSRAKVEAVADEVDATIRSMPGFVSIHYLANDATGEAGSFSLWQSKADAEHVGVKVNPRVAELLADVLQEGPTVRIFEIYEPPAEGVI